MPQRDPFSGAKLSKLVGPESAKLDQRLFGPAPTRQPPTPSPTAATPEAPKDAPTVALAQAEPRPKPKTAPPRGPAFHLSERPLYKLSYLYTQEEFNALEDLRADLSGDAEEKVTKNDIVRAALHLLLEDHAAKKSDSYATRKIRKR